MKYLLLFSIFSTCLFKAPAQIRHSNSEKLGSVSKVTHTKAATQETSQINNGLKTVVPKKVVPSIDLDKYLSYPSEAAAIREIDSLYPNTIIEKIENPQKALYERKFELVYHLIEQFEVKAGVDYLHNLNQYNFVCGVGLKRSKVVSPACLQPITYVANIESDNKVKLANLILTRGVKADFISVSMCVGKNELALFKLLYNNFSKETNSSIDGEKLLVAACGSGSYDIVNYLLENNISPNAYDHSVEKQDFKFYAIYKSVKYPEIFSLLTEKGADINIKGYRNTTPIIHAARDGCIEVLQYLLDKGIDPYEKQGDLSAYEMAKKFNQTNKKEVVKLIEKYKNK